MEHSVSDPAKSLASSNKAFMQSDVILSILQEIENEAKGPKIKSSLPQKNHMKENLRRLREIQAQAMKKKADKKVLSPLKVPYKSCTTELQNNEDLQFTANTRDLPKTAGPLRHQPLLSPSPSGKSALTYSLPSCRSLPHLNRLNDKEALSPRSEAGSAVTSHSSVFSQKKSNCKPESKHRLGHIPAYLTERKKQWEKEKEIKKTLQERASIPSGYTLLPNEERLETLDLLKKNQEELLQNLATLPVRNDTIRLRNYKEELEKQLAKVEEGIKIFAKPKVLIKNDDT